MKRPVAAPHRHSPILRRIEWIGAGIFALILVALHVTNMMHAGGLWRDEAAAVHLAQMPSVTAIWSHIEHESFPLLVTMLIRAWSGVGLGGSDAGLRAFGCLVGIAVVGALWWNAWRLSASPPFVSMLLLGLSPVAIRWGDSLRAYGVGVFFILIALASTWAVVRSPSRKNALIAMLAGVLAVQSLYQNAFVLAAICLGGVVVAARRKDLRRALLIGAVGVPAAFSLLPYLPVVKRANEWNVATQVPIDLARIWLVLHRALSDPHPLMLWLWAASLVIAVVIGCALAFRNKALPAEEERSDMAWFLLTILAASTLAYYVFLKVLNFPSEVWYYLVWMALAAVSIDALVARAARPSWARLVRIGAVAAAVAFLVPSVLPRLHMRMTNLDLVARHLDETVREGDLVLVHPWFCGATFARCYTGRAAWTTLPPLESYGLQRLDLFKAQMRQDDPLRSVIAKMEAAMRGGNTVWLVGHFPFSNPPLRPPVMPPAGTGPEGWRGAPYMTAYAIEAAYFLQMNATASRLVEVPADAAVNPFEDLPVRTISGWRRAF